MEVGPFFHPLITPDRFPNAKIFYWENDRYVLQYLEQTYAQESVYPIFCDLNNIDGNSLLKLSSQTKMAFFDKLQKDKISFDSVVLSHVLNYIDYKFFLIILTWCLKKGGYLFLNNVIDYGLPAFFSEHRPKSKQEILDSVEVAGSVLSDR